MSRSIRLLTALLTVAAVAAPAAAQNFTTADPVLRSIWEEGMDRSQVYPLAQTLMDSIGPRLTGSPGLDASHDWLVQLYRGWGIEAENEQYGTWKGWERGTSHVDLVSPRVRTLDATLLAWSPGTDGAVEGDVVLLPDPDEDLVEWRDRARGAFVLVSPPEPTCRPLEQWQELGGQELTDDIVAARAAARDAFAARAASLASNDREMTERLADAGVAGVLTSNWSGGYGARRIFGDRTGRVPTFSVSCEHFGLLYRLAEHGQGPVVRADARSQVLGEDVPVYNTVGTIPGTERPEEYVLLSAHLDSWDGGTGATDNGTGTIIMAEAMRLLKMFYPNPKRTIVVGHWGSEEQGLNGSRAFAADHPDIVDGLQAVFNQDNGTGRISRVSMQGLLDAGAHFASWLSALPSELSDIDVEFPGSPGSGGSDYAAFTCAGAPSFGLWAESWDYGSYTWHTNLDTFDKLAIDNVRHNAILIAMLAYMAAEDPELIERERRPVMPVDQRTDEPMEWPTCQEPDRSWEGYGQ